MPIVAFYGMDNRIAIQIRTNFPLWHEKKIFILTQYENGFSRFMHKELMGFGAYRQTVALPHSGRGTKKNNEDSDENPEIADGPHNRRGFS
jgi:hypothetical protein